MTFYYIANGKLYFWDGGKAEEITSGVLASYIDRVRDSAQRNEWKHSGEGARFRETFDPGADAESRIAAVSSRIFCAAPQGESLIYSLAIDRTTGIYRRTAGTSAEGIVISSGDYAYQDFDIRGERMVVSAVFAGESHIGVLQMNSPDCRMYTEGHCWDSCPVWSAWERDTVYYSSAGLAERSEEAVQRPMDMSQMVTQMFTASAPVTRGPSAIMKLNIHAGTLDEFLADDRYDFVRPQSMPDGSLYYIRRPYAAESGGSPMGCLGDLLMLPFRLLGALFGFLNVFTAKYSGKTLSKSAGVKARDEEKMFIDGNLINAEAELRANRSRGEQNPGIIPHTWELRCRRADGEDVLIRRGAAAYRVDEESEEILISNGSAIIHITPDGKEEKILTADKVTFIR